MPPALILGGFMGWESGVKSFTANGAVGTSDSSGKPKPVIIWDLALVGGTTATSVTLYNGGSTAANPVLRASVDSSGSKLDGDNFVSTNGLYCENGCYLGFKAAATATTATVSYTEDSL